MPYHLKRFWPAGIVLLFVGTILVTAMTGLIGAGSFDTSVLSSNRTWRIIRFSFLEASLSTALSLLVGTALALALHRRMFWGRSILISLLSASFVLPPLVIVTGIIGVFGRSGWLSQASELLLGVGFNQWLYGLPGILIAHVFFNAAFSARILLAQLNAIPATNWRTARQLGFKAISTWRLLDWPAIRPAVPSLATLIFLLTFTSFSIVLTLGGGPKATTLEVAIFEALKFDFDVGKAVTLSLLQILIGLLFLAFTSVMKFPWPQTLSPSQRVTRPDSDFLSTKIFDILALTSSIILLLLPILSLLSNGIIQVIKGAGLDYLLVNAIKTSLFVAICSAAITVSIALSVGLVQREAFAKMRSANSKGGRLIALVTNQAATIVLVVPIFVLSTGLFIIFRTYFTPTALTLPLLIIINALMALPFAAAVLSPVLIATANATDRNCLALGLTGVRRFQRIDFPLLKPALARASAYALALSLGDLGIVALFGSQNVKTLPFLLYQRMGSYRFGEAMATGFVLVILVVGIFLIVEAIGKLNFRKRYNVDA